MAKYTQKDLFGAGFVKGADGSYKRTKGPRAKPVKHEANLQVAVCEYLKEKYPDVIFTSDLSSGMKLTIGQSVKATKLRSSRGLPDISIDRARRGYHGLRLELKKEGTVIYKKDGELVADKHIREQAAILKRLGEEGYYATFAVGLSKTIEIIRWYLSTE